MLLPHQLTIPSGLATTPQFSLPLSASFSFLKNMPEQTAVHAVADPLAFAQFLLRSCAVSEQVRERLTREVKVLASLDHPNIVRYHDSWFDSRAPDPTLPNRFDATRHLQTVGRTSSTRTTTGEVSGGSSQFTRSRNHNSQSSQQHSASARFCIGRSSTDSGSPSTPACSASPPDDGVTWLYIQMELCRAGTLKDWLDNNRSRPVDRCVAIFKSVVKAIDYLHGRNFMHRDIKVSHRFSRHQRLAR